MFDFIPLKLYNPLFFHIMFIFVLITVFHTFTSTGYTRKTFLFNNVLALMLYIFFLMYTGLRPVSWVFGDMGNYAKKFYNFANYDDYVIYVKDIFFYGIMEFMASFGTIEIFFFTITLIYVTSTYFTAKRLFPKYYYFALLMLVGSFEYWSYGTNGIRNGMAAAIVLLAFTFMQNKKWITYLLFFIAFYTHSSALIPIAAYFVTSIYKSETLYFKIWIMSIFLSLLIGSQIENFIIGLGIMEEDTLETYFLRKDDFAYAFTMTGFRWDFLLYSSSAVFVSYYFIVKKKFQDTFYSHLTNIYLLSNSIWILVINASFSNRFAYLSWFMMGIVIIYPFLTKVFFKNQFKIIGLIILIYYLFTYLMYFMRF